MVNQVPIHRNRGVKTKVVGRAKRTKPTISGASDVDAQPTSTWISKEAVASIVERYPYKPDRSEGTGTAVNPIAMVDNSSSKYSLSSDSTHDSSAHDSSVSNTNM